MDMLSLLLWVVIFIVGGALAFWLLARVLAPFGPPWTTFGPAVLAAFLLILLLYFLFGGISLPAINLRR